MHALVVGLGSIGRRHLTVLREVAPGCTITAWRRAGASGDLPPGVDRVVGSAAEALALRPAFAVIATPASVHLAAARTLAEAGLPLLVEKPFSDRLGGVNDIIDLSARNGAALAVAYNLRFHPPLQAVRAAVAGGAIGRVLSVQAVAGQYLPDWRPGTDYRMSASARAELGGGVVLELSHEFDYLRWIVGEVRRVSARLAKVSDLEIDVEDTADVMLEFESGAVANVHLDMVQRTPVRGCRIAGERGTIVWNGIANQATLHEPGGGAGIDLHPAQAIERDHSYRAQMEHFLDCVSGAARPEVSGEDGRRALEVALAAKESHRIGGVVTL